MRKMILVAVTAALAVAACGGSSDSAATTTTAVPTTAAPQATTTAAVTTTAAPTTADVTTTTGATDASGDPDVAAITMAYEVAFDSTSGYDEKAKYIDDPSGLEDTVASYLDIGETMGGVSVAVTGVTIDGTEAEVGYDLLFGGHPTYPDLTGTAVKTDAGWQVPRSMFCEIMADARVGCP
jgi:ABC-type transport system substrate-binding protein